MNLTKSAHSIYTWMVPRGVYIHGGACGIMVIVVGNEQGDISSNLLDESDCISHNTNTLGKGMNPIINHLAMGK